MKRLSMVGFVTKPVLASLISLTAMILFAGGAHGAITCDQCHGNNAGDYRPLDTPSGSIPAYRNITTGAFKGNHQTHMAPATSQTVCTPCHGNSGYTASHRDGIIQFNSNINTSPATGQYKVSGVPITFKNQTSVPILGTCSSVNCHFETVTPAWGGAPFSSTADCSACHSTPATSGAHAKHGTYTSAFKYSNLAGCTKCHPDWATGLKFSHATSAGHAGRNIAMSLSEGGYSPGNWQYLPSQSGTRTFGTCSNLYCHSQGTSNVAAFPAPNTAAKWDVSVNCGGCHNSGAAMSSPAGGYGHTKHVSTYSFGCVKCHAATVSDNATISNKTVHVERLVTVQFNNRSSANSTTTYKGANAFTAAAQRTPGEGYASAYCLNTYCHSQGKSATTYTGAGFAGLSSARWGAALPTNCTACHGGSNANAFKLISTVVHRKHMAGGTTRYNFGCADCHKNTATSNTAVDVAGGKHVNYQVNVDFSITYGGTYSANNHLPGGAVGTCNSVYCHSNGQSSITYAPLTWTTGSLACTGCHGGASNPATLSGKHQGHLDTAFNTSLGTAYGCVDCHALTVSDNTTIIPTAGYANHVNKFRDFSGARAYKTGWTGSTCAVYCHSAGKPGVAGINNQANPNWTGAAFADCKQCHGGTGGAFTGLAGEPNYTSGGSGAAAANSHQKHVTVGAADCVSCHQKTVTAAGAIITGTTRHTDKTIDVNLSKLAPAFNTFSGVYNLPGKTCSATYCHGSGTPTWGAVGSTNCTSCHSANNSGYWATNSAHKLHEESATLLPANFTNISGNVSASNAYRFSCSACHNPAGGAVHANGAKSAVRAADVFFGYTTAGVKPTYNEAAATSGTEGSLNWSAGSATNNCNASYCHGNGQAARVNGTVVYWNTTVNGGTCTTCHGSATAGNALSGKHQQHVNNVAYLGTDFGCVDCHAKTVDSNTNVNNKAKHVNKFIDYSGARAGKNKTCANFYCHSDGKGNFANPTAWTVASTPLACNACHPNTSLVHPKHLSYASITCDDCHNNTAASNTALKAATTTHINGTYNVNLTDVKFANMSAAWKAGYTSGTKTCSNIYCHSNAKGTYQSVVWSPGGLNCSGCHPTLSGAHGKHVKDLLTTVTFYNYTANQSTGDDTVGGWGYKFGCANCHPTTLSSHINGSIDVELTYNASGVGSIRAKNGSAGAGARYNADKTCDQVYCHSDGKNAPGLANAPAWTTTFVAMGGDRCAKCHGNSPTTGGHQAHVVGIHYDDLYSGVTGLLAKSGAVGVSAGHGDPAQSTTLNCNICHNTTVTAAKNDKNTFCSTVNCHDTGARLKGDASIASLAAHVNGKTELSFYKAAAVRTKAQIRDTSFAVYTAAGGYWTRNGSYKAGAASYDSAKTVFADNMFNQVSKDCSNIACHNGKTVNWTNDVGKAAQCVICHTRL